MRLSLALGLSIALSIAAPAYAQSATEATLGLAIAKVCANESGFDSPADCDLIWQATRNGATPPRDGRVLRAQLAWLRAHSRRVLGTRRCLRGNCLWSRHLRRSSRAPEGWPASARWRPEAWAAMLAQADAMVAGTRSVQACEGRPITWGGSMDRAGAIRRGLVPLACTQTRNVGYASPRRLAWRVRVVRSSRRTTSTSTPTRPE